MLICSIQCFNVKLYVAYEKISAPKDGNITMQCLHGTDGVDYIEWIESYGGGSPKPVAQWIKGSHTDSPPWDGRTDIPSAEGDLTIINLILQDDGKYTSLWHEPSTAHRSSI